MLTVYKRFNHQLQIVTDSGPVSKSWIRMVNPTQDEINTVTQATGVPEDLLRAALDAEERSRIEIEDNCLLVLTNFPILRGPNIYDTLPLGIILTADQVITVSLEETEILPGNIVGPGAPAHYNTGKRTRFLFQILYKTAKVYLRFINQINRQTDEIERHLRKSMNNAEVFQLLDLEKGLTYFTVALRTNGIVLDKLLRLRIASALQHLLPQYEEDEDILEDAIIENQQALEMVKMYSDILSGMMDAFTSVISNNLNQVMKLLASITILISIPTMISSFWGMNVGVPFPDQRAGFWLVLLLSLSLTSIAGFVLWRKRMF
ncbi:MAG: magnesium transporter CorA family protein [Desulfobulbaceae bacterium]|jgi:magnesium transporter|nr:magnesium transporter CorA family protein [Desulfobulbaceae bacterium]